MRIHIVTHDDMDGFLWGVIEGWLHDGTTLIHEVRVSGGRTLLGPASPDFWETLPTADAILFCVTSGKPTHFARAVEVIEAHNLWGRVVFHDYAHNDHVLREGTARKCRFQLVGKRLKYLTIRDLPSARWLPRTGIQTRVRRYAPALPWDRWKDLSGIGVYHTFKAAQKHRIPWLHAAATVLSDGVFGSVAPGFAVGQGTIPTAPAAYAEPFGTRHNPAYLELASRARIGLYLMGGNALGHQFWEFAALGCALVAAHPSTHPAPEEDTQEWEHFDEGGGRSLVEGEDFVYF